MAATAVVVEEVVRLLKAAMVAVADLAGARAHPTPDSHARIRAMAREAVSHQVSHGKPTHRVSATRKRHASTASNSARTRAARAWTWAKTSAMTLTNANLPAMCQQASHHLACPRAAAVVAAEAAIVVVAAETSVEAARALAAAVVAEQVVADAATARAVAAAHTAADKTKRAHRALF